MITNNMNFFCFICIVFVTLQTSHSIQEHCKKYDTNIKSCKNNGVTFYLRTKTEDKNADHELVADNVDTIKNADFFQGKPLKFIIHGHNEHMDDFLVTPLQEEYFKLQYNVVMINYSSLSHGNCYRTGVDNSIPISRCAAEIIEAIVQNNNKGIKIEDFHLIGLSLGGQMVGQIPHVIHEQYRKSFSRITGIDPANDGFFEDYGKDDYILTADDAKLVDVIHSNGGINGKLPPMGHIDWYPNGGSFQPECPIGDHLCDHISSLIYYVESIGDSKFRIEAQWCPDLETKIFKPDLCDKPAKVPFGEYVSLNDITTNIIKKGVYFFTTKDTPPYIRQGAEIYSVYEDHKNFSIKK